MIVFNALKKRRGGGSSGKEGNLTLVDSYALPSYNRGMDWSPDGSGIIIAHKEGAAPNNHRLTLLSFVNEELGLKALATTTDDVYQPKFSPNGSFVAMPQDTVKYVAVYAVGETSLTLEDELSSYSGTDGLCVDWVSDTRLIAGIYTFSTGARLLGFDGNSLSHLETLGLATPSHVETLGNYVVVLVPDMDDGLTLYKLSDDSLVYCDRELVGYSNCRQVSFDKDGQYLLATSQSNKLSLLSMSGDSLVFISDFSDMFSSVYPYAAYYSPTGPYIAVTMYTNGIYVLKQEGETLSKIGEYTAPATCNYIAWSPDGDYLAIGYSASPYFSVLKFT